MAPGQKQPIHVYLRGASSRKTPQFSFSSKKWPDSVESTLVRDYAHHIPQRMYMGLLVFAHQVLQPLPCTEQHSSNESPTLHSSAPLPSRKPHPLCKVRGVVYETARCALIRKRRVCLLHLCIYTCLLAATRVMAKASSSSGERTEYEWERLPDMPVGRCFTVGAYHEGKLYVIGN